MPNYVYRAVDRSGATSCPLCRRGFRVTQRISDKALEECEVCISPIRRVIQSVKFRFRHGMKGDCRDYRDDLARFAGDPEAYVDGPRSLQKLIDKRKREGWEIKKGFDAPSEPKLRSSQEVVREAYERAAARGFTPTDE